jgi:hypothetical protein
MNEQQEDYDIGHLDLIWGFDYSCICFGHFGYPVFRTFAGEYGQTGFAGMAEQTGRDPVIYHSLLSDL